MMKITLVVLIDLGFAALAFYALLPAGHDVAFGPFLTGFLIAIMAGLVCGTPGGIGAFELVLLVHLPNLAPEQVISTALAFRIVYHALPAALGALALLMPSAERTNQTPTSISYPSVPILPPRVALQMWNAPFAEAMLIRQGEFGTLVSTDAAHCLVAETTQSLVVLGRPFATQTPENTMRTFARYALRRGKSALIYKADGRTAAQCRRLGWRVLAVAQEAWVRPRLHSSQGPEHRQLRRMLRKAEAAKISVRAPDRRLPLHEMAKGFRQLGPHP